MLKLTPHARKCDEMFASCVAEFSPVFVTTSFLGCILFSAHKPAFSSAAQCLGDKLDFQYWSYKIYYFTKIKQ